MAGLIFVGFIGGNSCTGLPSTSWRWIKSLINARMFGLCMRTLLSWMHRDRATVTVCRRTLLCVCSRKKDPGSGSQEERSLASLPDPAGAANLVLPALHWPRTVNIMESPYNAATESQRCHHPSLRSMSTRIAPLPSSPVTLRFRRLGPLALLRARSWHHHQGWFAD